MAKRKKRSRKGKMPAGLKAYWAGKRRTKSNPKRARKATRSRRRTTRALGYSRRTKKAMAGYGPNPGRRSRSRSYRRNPGLQSGFIMDAVYVTGGFFATRALTGYVMPYLPMADQPIVRIAAKGGVAFGLGWLGNRFLGQRSGQLLMLGGLVEALSDAVRTYVSPYVPALSDGMSSYPELSSYPSLMGEGYSNPYSVGINGFDEV